MVDDDRTLSVSQLRDVIERAARTTDESERISVADLFEIAAELELDPRTVEAALEEVLSEASTTGGSSLRAHLTGMPAPSDLRTRRPLAVLTFAISSALLTPGDSVILTLALSGSMVLVYEAFIRLFSLAWSERGGDPTSGSNPATASAESPLPLGSETGADPEQRGVLERLKAQFIAIEEGVRAFQAVARSI